MKALTVTRFEKKGLAGIELLDIAKPQPKPGQLLVRMKAAAFNPADLHIASGEMSMMSPVKTSTNACRGVFPPPTKRIPTVNSPHPVRFWQ